MTTARAPAIAPAFTPAELLSFQDRGALWPANTPSPAFEHMADAYQTALAVRALRMARGEQPRGFKVGFTNRHIWPRYQVFAPIWGTVWDRTLAHCDGTGELDLQATSLPRIEPELVFGLKRTPPPDADLQALFDSLDWLAPGVEIVQSHRPDWRFGAAAETVDREITATVEGFKQ